MSTVSQFLALASGSSGGGLTSFREVYQNTDTPYAYTTGSPVILNLSTASTIYDLSTVHPGYPTIVHDTSITNDIVRYTLDTTKIYDHHAGYTVASATKDTLTATSTVTVLVNNLTGVVRELAVPSLSTGIISMWVIGNDGFLYFVDSTSTGSGYVIGDGNNGVANAPLRVTAYSLATAAVAGTVSATYGSFQSTGGSGSGNSTVHLHFVRPGAVNTGYVVCVAAGNARSGDSTAFTSAVHATKINFNGGSSTASTIYVNTANASGCGAGCGNSPTSGNFVGYYTAGTGACQGGFVFTTRTYSYASASDVGSQMYMILDETREVQSGFANTGTFVGVNENFIGSGAVLKDGSTLVYVRKSGTSIKAMWASDTTQYRSYTLTQSNPSLDNLTAGQMDRCMQYGTYKNRFICGLGTYTVNAVAKTIVFNKILYTVPGNNTLLQAYGAATWATAYYVSNSVSGSVTQLYTSGIDVNSVDPTIIPTVSGSPAGFSSTENIGFLYNTLFGIPVISGQVVNSINSAGNLVSQYGVYGTVSGERMTRNWGGITSGSTVTSSSDLSMTGRVPYLSGSNYVNATVKGLLNGSSVRFDKVRFVVRLPAYTNTSTGASTILIRILPNSNELKNIKIVNTPTQDVYVHSATQIGIRVGAATNITAEDIIIEADTILRFTGGGLLVNNTYAPLTGTITLTLSNLAASSRLMSELFQ